VVRDAEHHVGPDLGCGAGVLGAEVAGPDQWHDQKARGHQFYALPGRLRSVVSVGRTIRRVEPSFVIDAVVLAGVLFPRPDQRVLEIGVLC
jgi:hypothetical protein